LWFDYYCGLNSCGLQDNILQDLLPSINKTQNIF